MMQKARLTIAACGVPVHHFGKLDRDTILKKGEHYFLLGLKKIDETGGTSQSILELAIQAGELGRYDDAIRLWKRFLGSNPSQHVSRAYTNLLDALLSADRFDEALAESRKAVSQANSSRELRLNCANAEFFAGDLRKAIRMAEKIRNKHQDYPPVLILLTASYAMVGQPEKSAECLTWLRKAGLDPASQLRPVIAKLRRAGKEDEADQLLGLFDGEPRVRPRAVPAFSGAEPAREPL
jgi:tetratricopeptide (TPR) repeat protein